MEDIDAAFTQSVTREPDPAAQARPQYPTGMGQPPPPPPPSSITLSGLLNAIDGVQAQQGRLLFATTNKYDALDPALMRPGRLDLHIEFKQATKWQAAELFKRFYPVERDRSYSIGGVSGGGSEKGGDNEREKRDDLPPESPTAGNEEDLSGVQRVSTHGPSATQRKSRKAPKLTHQELEDLAHQFADAIPEEELSMAYVTNLTFRLMFLCSILICGFALHKSAIQGHLMMHKTRPHAAVRTAPRFVTNERERRIKAREITKEQALDQEKAREANKQGDAAGIPRVALNGIKDGEIEGSDVSSALSSPPTLAQSIPSHLG